ncbi:MAG: TrkA family potassium uptake protein [Acidimicrobiia bacterium]
MKSLALVLSTLSASLRRRDVRLLGYLLALFAVVVFVFVVVFHALMAREGQRHSWATAVYWTLVTMTTLGFGDITFQSDAGRLFSVVVLLTGSIFLLVVLPFTFIQFVFIPWMSRLNAERAPRQLPVGTSGHLVLTSTGPIEDALIREAYNAGVPYVVLVGELDEALRLHDTGYSVMLGAIDDPAAYRAARVEQAALVTATRADTTNANITFTVREITRDVPVVATVSSPAAMDILQLAGADKVIRLGDLLGTAMAERTIAPDGRSHPIGRFEGLIIATARVHRTDLVGTTIAQADLRGTVGVSAIGVWDHGVFRLATADSLLSASSVLILAGDRDQLDRYDRRYSTGTEGTEAAVIIGGGRVGRAAGRAFAAVGTRYRIIEQRAERIRDPDHYVLGDAADLDVLEEAGIRTASGAIITTHDDDMNIFLSIYCRRLRPDLRIVARANLDRNVSTLYRAGADDVLSYASTGAAAIWNHVHADATLVIAEGLSVFRVPVPPSLAGKTLVEADLRRTTGCHVVGIDRNGVTLGNPAADTVLHRDAEMLLIGDEQAEARFAERHPPRRRRSRWRTGQ